MLVLSRRPGEKIAIGDHVMISVLQVKGDRVLIGIQAPADLLVLREELIEAVAQENAAAHQRRSRVSDRPLVDIYRQWSQRLAGSLAGESQGPEEPRPK
ncbi:MAG: carbon storage regulator [Anaerolineae bacterium]|jgi:carbon storage regulator